MTEYRMRTFGPWDCDGGTGDVIVADGAIGNATVILGNPTVDGVGAESKKRKHHKFPGMQDAPRERLVKARS